MSAYICLRCTLRNLLDTLCNLDLSIHERRTSGEVWDRSGGLDRSQHLGRTLQIQNLSPASLSMEHFGEFVCTNFTRLSIGNHPLKQD